MRTLFLSLALAALATSGQGQSLQIVGYVGELGEWELTASIGSATEDVRSRELSGPLTLRHVGICTQDGPGRESGRNPIAHIGAVIRTDGDFAG